MNSILKKYFAYFYKKSFKLEYEFKSKDDDYINSFVEILIVQYQDGVSEEWIFEYLAFQFNKYSEAETRMKIQLQWIYGKKALEKWRSRDLEHHQYFDNFFKEKYNIKKRDLIHIKNQNVSKKYKSRERNRFEDQVRKYLHCIELDLFDEKDSDCMFCKNKDKCHERVR